MKNALLVALAVFMLYSCGGTKATTADKNDTGAYIAPDYKKKKYKKILVLAMLQQIEYRKRVEKSLVDQLKARNFSVVASTELFTDEMLKDTLAIRKTAEDAGIDAAILLTSLGTDSKTVDRAAFNGNMFGWFGFTFAVVDQTSNVAKVNYMQMDFLLKDKLGTQYRVAVPVNTSNNSDVALQQFSLQARNRLITDKIL
jgi:ABC-type branched-subunit amino acid transport system substrate-binding protein